MKRVRLSTLLAASAFCVLIAQTALAAGINSIVAQPRIWNDCSGSSLTVTDNDFASMAFLDDLSGCSGGYANLHVWRLSSDNAWPSTIGQGTDFTICATVTIGGTGFAEAGIQISPWWSLDVDGRFNVRNTDGEIACFGGRLPFYSFTAQQGLVYSGGPIRLTMEYHPNGLSAASPATIEYKITYNAVNYTSGVKNFDSGNPAEDPPHGLWGILKPARAGGYVQEFVGGHGVVNTTYTDICFTGDATPTKSSSWGQLKTSYR